MDNMEYERFNHGVHIHSGPSKCSIYLNNVFKTHKNQNVLNGVNLTAHSGIICAVLGEMQSGKSMLLSCLVGGDKIDSGNIWVLGGRPRSKSSKAMTKNVGYMPQEFCIYETMTILELLVHFGHLYDINHAFILWRITYYNNIFTLPPANVPVKNMSFSEKRMVSFLIAVFHRPRLVVLDEPTVGLDVFKKKQIWKYLYYIISTWKPTIIVATNNIEEAFIASKIAYLKDGKILFVREVEELQETYPDESLDAIIDDLCTNLTTDYNDNYSDDRSTRTIPLDKQLSISKQVKPRSNIWKFRTIVNHNLHFLTKNIWIMILTCMCPLFEVLMHCFYYGAYPNPLLVAVYNQEADCIRDPCGHIIGNCTYFSCHFLYLLTDNKIELKYFDDESLARDSTIKGSRTGFVRVPKNYTETLVKIITGGSPYERDGFSTSAIFVEIDISTFEFGSHLKLLFQKAHKSHLASVYSRYNLSGEYAEMPFNVLESNNLDFTENTASEVISCAIFSSATFFSSLLIQSEIKNGYLTRNMTAGITIFEIILSLATIHLIFSIFQSFFLFLLVDILLHIKWSTSLLLIVSLDCTIGICGMSIGLFIGSISSSPSKAFHLAMGSSVIQLIMSGLFWPSDNMTFALNFISNILPLSLPIKAVKKVMIQGSQFKIKEIFYAVISISCWTIISLTAFILKLNKK